ncbi:MAG: AMP-binding protein [Lachnospiraceae bacterium]|nr:AMP-binding protein [Lachnospiraceae bacterium]
MAEIIRDLLAPSVEAFGMRPAIAWLEKRKIKEMTYEELSANASRVRSFLLETGFTGRHIALIGQTSPEWLIAYFGIVTGPMTAVPLDASLPDRDLIRLLQRSDASLLFLSQKRESLMKEVREECPQIKRIIFFSDILALDPIDAERDAVPQPEDVATIIFTSGTTGVPKGVMLTQRNLYTNVVSVPVSVEPGTSMLSVLPIHHAYCLVCDYLKGLSLGARICMNDSLMHMVKNMSVFHPQITLMVPLMIETIARQLEGLYPSVPKAAVAEKIFGGKLTTIYSGGAHLEKEYIDLFREYGVSIYEGYGMSECSPVIADNTADHYRDGSVGRPLANVEVKFENEELMVRGSSVMKGYYKMPEETEKALTPDGWLHTGDKGRLDEDGYLYITGRVKNLIILSNGENVSPEEIEGKLALLPLIQEVIVTGGKNGLVAHIYPDPQETLKEFGEPFDPAVRQSLQKAVDAFNLTQPTYRHINDIVIRRTPFLKSTTQKILRQKIDIEG